jgi:Mrp family chromosome partitioning ATPase/capsular polysaccharide biosynthesis protein
MNQPERTPFNSERGSIRYLAAIREHWLVIVAIVITAVAWAAVYSFTAAKQYKAEASLLVTPISGSDPTYLGTGLLSESGSQVRGALTIAQLVRTPQTAVRANAILGRELSTQQLLGMISVNPIGQSDIVTVVANAGDPTFAADVANAFARAIVDLRTAEIAQNVKGIVKQLSQRLAVIPAADRSTSASAQAIQTRLVNLQSLLNQPDPTLRVVDAAVPPTAASWPKPKLSIAIAFLAALILGIGIALALEFLAPDVKNEEELLFEQRLPVLARVPRMRRHAARAYMAGAEPLPAEAWEAYRTLRASLAIAGKDGGFPSTVLVTSAAPAEGKTMTAMNLSLTLVRAGLRVILVDGDFRRPMIASAFGVAANRRGLAQLLTGGGDPARLYVPAPGYEKSLLLLISQPEDASLVDLLEPRRLADVMEKLRERADVVVIDSPPFSDAAEVIAYAEVADVTLIAIRLGRTRRDKLNDLCRALVQRRLSPAGFVVTTRRRPRASAYSYGYSAPPESPMPGRRRQVANRGDNTGQHDF